MDWIGLDEYSLIVRYSSNLRFRITNNLVGTALLSRLNLHILCKFMYIFYAVERKSKWWKIRLGNKQKQRKILLLILTVVLIKLPE